MKKSYFIFFILLLGVFADRRTEVKLLDHLFRNYHPDALPTLPGKGVNLTFDIALRQLIRMDESIEIIVVNTWIRQFWQDPFLTWNASEWEGINSVTVSPNKIWKPDITVYNNAEQDFQGLDYYGKTKVIVYSDGNIVWLIPTLLRTTCKLDMSYFPFDEQVCPLIFGSWAYDQVAIDLYHKNPTGDLSILAKSSEFIISGFEAVRVSELFKCCPNPYVSLTYKLHFQRRAKFYLFKIILPGVLIALLSCFSFILPPLSGDRVGLVITNFLSLSFYVLIVSDFVPPSSDTLPLLVKFYTLLMNEIGLALMTNCVIICLNSKNVPVPNWVRLVFLNNHFNNFFYFLRRKLLSKCIIYEFNDDISLRLLDTSLNKNESFSQNESYAKKQNVPSNNTLETNPDLMLRSKCSEIISSELINLYDSLLKLERNNDLKYLKTISDYVNTKTRQQSITADWEDVVRSIDKIFFIIFVLLIVGSVAFIFAFPPKTNF
ncbi:neuronal acetylcholine receptor subunit alpha-10 isoform X1 [Hydra vulgaris]|uniref:neuronal acetylcholine receptor subunit alpha-10 isoform X1 n=1 Tax=Hydra vulgaris TaxID=6087 RepID=UPI000641304F|nr:neuronal acetylcholine receptor subunit alpha-10 isoform X1 [Hydra vulgaris]XP_047123166.1 neuronal acetylcholine receptor subunit alpha-10 isoform X1 [Hydra vulgaris]XP_047123167.1 neuronal acetylcholine receptor subunit alpha-10 isoform X1 [Hydra vulgaris]XP_047123168.1 neuronal acetylcholine receptor subunit alpha-10 isoform X1 [Hydra vulgaris]